MPRRLDIWSWLLRQSEPNANRHLAFESDRLGDAGRSARHVFVRPTNIFASTQVAGPPKNCVRRIGKSTTLSEFPPPQLRIATRESPLAMWQAEHVAALLRTLGVATTIVPLVSSGDTDMSPIDGTRSVGLFTKRIQQALIDGEADIAVHSLKDLPTEPDDRFRLAAVPERETVEDCLISRHGGGLSNLPPHARVGTGSTRRIAQLRAARPDLDLQPIRGNVQTRLSKVESREFDAIVLARAGLLRLEMEHVATQTLPLELMLPAPGQGALAIEVRGEDETAWQAVSKLDDRHARLAVTAERAVLAALHGGCLAPIAAHGNWTNDTHLQLTALVLSADGSRRLIEQTTGEFVATNWHPTSDPDSVFQTDLQAAANLGQQAAERLREAGAVDIITATRSDSAG